MPFKTMLLRLTADISAVHIKIFLLFSIFFANLYVTVAKL